MISAYESIDLVERCILSGADAYLLKPLRVRTSCNLTMLLTLPAL